MSAPLKLALRAMVPEDLGQVICIEQASFATPWSLEIFRRELEIPFSRAVVLHVIGSPTEVVGYMVHWVVADEVHLLDLAVHPASRGRGAGRFLLETLLHESRDARARLVTLEVASSNAVAVELYRSMGFVECRRRRDYYAPAQDALVMEWRGVDAAPCHGDRKGNGVCTPELTKSSVASSGNFR
jgi:ribosomal-protein-alanine N-acetyltransferase